ncbi:MAG: hypothetical protein LBS10_00230 [Gracilibacteraceae bacterium]|jgi:hypothetical protein|nr:hypothetical protein [Gracilibacteraceae bacterium]
MGAKTFTQTITKSGDTRAFSVVKSDDDKRQVFGWTSMAVRVDGETIVDWQMDITLFIERIFRDIKILITFPYGRNTTGQTRIFFQKANGRFRSADVYDITGAYSGRIRPAHITGGCVVQNMVGITGYTIQPADPQPTAIKQYSRFCFHA